MYIFKIYFLDGFSFECDINILSKDRFLCLILEGISAKSHAPTIYTPLRRDERNLNLVTNTKMKNSSSNLLS